MDILLNLPVFILVFALGLIVGSFLNCFIYRLAKKESFVSGRSHCPYCFHTLSWKDLVPLASFFYLKGRCRYCKERISVQYPLVEFSTGLLFVLVFIQNVQTLFVHNLVFALLNIIFWLIVSSILIVIFVYDLRHYIVPDSVIYPAVLLTAVWRLAGYGIFHVFSRNLVINILYSALSAAAFFLAIVLVSRGKGMGMGDVKLAFLMGLLLGFPDIAVALALSFFLGAAVGTVLIAAGKKGLKSEVPFAPFLVSGTFLALFFAEKIMDFYMKLII